MTTTPGRRAPARGRPRRDAVRNRERLLEAAGELLRADPGGVSMPAIADRAGLSVPTAYRYYSALDDLLNAYLHRVIVELRDYSHDCPKTGPALFEEVAGEWARLLESYGAAMVQLRARSGFLARLRGNDPVISTVREAWERPVRSVMRHLEIPDEHFEHALFLCNIMFDPREILDLVETGLTREEALRHLEHAYFQALVGWANAAGA
ncbi:TetR/AcrR family transcriptional regulator [Saccharopolyspora pogona]|uniref:TetR/AcrR family transcriptional regulator n=1 Tax=Saccharopolyspora pogona TaxID=333966 RepID=UPI0016868FD0